MNQLTTSLRMKFAKVKEIDVCEIIKNIDFFSLGDRDFIKLLDFQAQSKFKDGTKFSLIRTVSHYQDVYYDNY